MTEPERYVHEIRTKRVGTYLYERERKDFEDWCRAQGLTVSGGLRMLAMKAVSTTVENSIAS